MRLTLPLNREETETFPPLLSNNGPWAYFRRELDDGARYFFNGTTWVMQTKAGHLLQFGLPLDGVSLTAKVDAGVERTDSHTASTFGSANTNTIYRWNLVRDTDASGNAVYYCWDDQHSLLSSTATTAGTAFLTDVYDTLQINAAVAPLNFAHHVHLKWQLAQTLPGSTKLSRIAYDASPIWAAPPFAQLQQVEVTSAHWTSATITRTLVRGYDLEYTYNSSGTRSFLTVITPFGAYCCSASATCDMSSPYDFSAYVSPPENADGSPPVTDAPNSGFFCLSLPGTAYTYAGIRGENFSAPTVLKTTTNPYFTTADPIPQTSPVIALADINGDAIADLVTTQTNGVQLLQLGPHTVPATTQPAGGSLLQTCNAFDWPAGIFGPWVQGVNELSILSNSVPGSGGAPQVCAFNISSVATGVVFDGIGAGLAQQFSASQQALLSTYSAVSAPNRAVDVDGDGLPDIALAPFMGNTSATPTLYTTLFSTRDRNGTTYPFLAPSPSTCPSPDYDPTNFGTVFNDTLIIIAGGGAGITGISESTVFASPAIRAFTDIDGDGLPDLVTANKFACPGCLSSTANPAGAVDPAAFTGLLVLPNRGDGRFGVATSGSSGACYDSYGGSMFPSGGGPQAGPVATIQSDPTGSGTFGNAFVPGFNNASQGAIIRFGDLNADGLADYAVLDAIGLSVCMREGLGWDSAFWRCEIDTSRTILTNGAVDLGKDIQIADLDGSGVNQVVYFDATSSSAYQLSPSGVTGGDQPRDGLLQTITSSAGLTTTLQYATVASLGIGPLPSPTWVVTKSTTTNNIAGSQGITLPTDYEYSNPLYDSRDHLFVGFGSVTEVLEGAGNVPGTVTKTTFATQSCNALNLSCLPTALDYGFFRATRGLPTLVEISEQGSGTKFESVFNEYRIASPYSVVPAASETKPAGLDGRSTLLVSLYQKHTYLWDETQAGSNTSLQSFPDFAGTFVATKATLPAAQVLRRTVVDPFGNPGFSVDFGLVGVDTPVLHQRMWNFGTGDTSGWTFRLQQMKIGSTDATGTTFSSVAPVREYNYVYNAAGLLTDVFGALASEPLLLGPGQSVSSRAAKQPQGASTTGSVHLRHMEYDLRSNLTKASTELSGNAGDASQCVVIVPDTLYGQLPASFTVFPNGCGSMPALQTTLVFDRGFEKVTSTLSPGQRMTNRTYDPFGRVVASYQPSATTLNMTSDATFASYDDGPISDAFVTAPDGSVHRRYFDGFGNLLAEVDDAGTGASTNQWVVSGFNTRTRGRVTSALKPFYLTSRPSGGGNFPFPLSATNNVPGMSFTYDGAGRLLSRTDFLGALTSFKYHTAQLSVDVRDPEQIAGSHTGSFTTLRHDGLGRLAETDQHLANGPQGSGVFSTITQYLPTGEPTVITQSDPKSSKTRTMAYDTLGRMVTNNEPNVGQWTYAYNDAGQLVGTSDARGCGKNIFRDGLGRVTAEDYSPCDPSQACRRRRRRVPLSPESPVPRDPPAGAETVFRDVLSGGDAHEGGALGSMALRSAVSSPLRGEIGIRLGRCDSLSRARSAPRAR